jgi:hypothetical protein
LPRLADVISDTDKGKKSLRARKFALVENRLYFFFMEQYYKQQHQPNKFNYLIMISIILCFWTERSEDTVGRLLRPDIVHFH